MSDDNRKTLAKLEYSIDADGEIYIDILIDDYSSETITQFGVLLASISSASFQIQTLNVAQEAFSRDGRVDELKLLLREIIKRQASIKLLEEDSDADNADDPLIKPTDLM